MAETPRWERWLRRAAGVAGALTTLAAAGQAAVRWLRHLPLRSVDIDLIADIAATVFYLGLAVWIAVFTRIVLRMRDAQEQAIAELKAKTLDETRQFKASVLADVDERLSKTGR